MQSPLPTLLIANPLAGGHIKGQNVPTIQTSTPSVISGSCMPGLERHLGQAHRSGTITGAAEYPSKEFDPVPLWINELERRLPELLSP